MEYLIPDMLTGLMYAIVLGLIVVILKRAMSEPVPTSRQTTEEANRVIFSAPPCSLKEAEEIMYEYFEEV